MRNLEALEIILLTQCLLSEQVNKQILKFQQVTLSKLVHNTQLKQLERENCELKQADEILRKASAFFACGTQPPTKMMVSFID